MASRISAAEAAQTFPEVLERVRSQSEVFIVEHAGEPICQSAPSPPYVAHCVTLRDGCRASRDINFMLFDNVEAATKPLGGGGGEAVRPVIPLKGN
jgi:hypothetical protein